MSPHAASPRALDTAASSARDVLEALRGAFQALDRIPPPARPTFGALSPPRLPATVREAWVAGIEIALQQIPLIPVTVSPQSLLYGDAPILEGGLAARLHAAGLRVLDLFIGPTERELTSLGALLASDWAGDRERFEEALWAADLPHVWYELVEGTPAAVRAAFPSALSRLEIGPEEPRRTGYLSTNAAAALHDLRAMVAPEPVGLLDAHAAGAPAAPLKAEVALLRTAGDIEPRDLAGAFGEILARAEGPEDVRRAVAALLGAGVDLMGSADAGPLLHRALEAFDEDFEADPERRAAARGATAALSENPLRQRLTARLPAHDPGELRGSLFSLFSLVTDETVAAALAEVLPRWAQGVLADATHLRDPENAAERLDAVRRRLTSASPAVIALGLGIAARLEDARVLDTVLALGDHADPGVREAALVALRAHALPRVRDLVLRRLDDPALAVRLEALRYGAAHRVQEVLPHLDRWLASGAAEASDEHEARAVCIAYARIARDAAEAPLREIALGRRRSGPTFARQALHGLRAIGTPAARASIEHVATEVPRLREDAATVLAEWR